MPSDASKWESLETRDILIPVPDLVAALESREEDDLDTYLDILVKMMMAVVEPMYKTVLRVRIRARTRACALPDLPKLAFRNL